MTANACVVDPVEVSPGGAESWFGLDNGLTMSHARTQTPGQCDRMYAYGVAGGTPMVKITFGPPYPAEVRAWHGTAWHGPEHAPTIDDWRMTQRAEHVEFIAHAADQIADVAVLLVAFWRRFGGTLVADEAIRAWIRTSTP